MRFKIFSWIGALLIFSSCDCLVAVNGKIISSKTGNPLQGAEIRMIEKGFKTQSDANGNFILKEATGFCYTPKIKVEYPNYKPFEIKIISDSKTKTYVVSKELISIDYKEPFYPNPLNKSTYFLSTWINKFSQNFKIKSDSLIIYLDEDNRDLEISAIKQKLSNSNY